jgi:hypothetical protein
MDRRIPRIKRWRCVLILLLFGSIAAAQQDAGSMRSQGQSPPSAVQPTAPQSTLELPTGPSNPVLEIPGKFPDAAQSVLLPSLFVGCWEGTIENFDTLEPIAFCHH